jgi:hypothetical protein
MGPFMIVKDRPLSEKSKAIQSSSGKETFSTLSRSVQDQTPLHFKEPMVIDKEEETIPS